MAHPLLQGLDRDAGVVAHCAVSDPEIMAFYIHGMPGRERLSFLYKCLMLFRFSVPASIAAVELRFKEENIGFISVEQITQSTKHQTTGTGRPAFHRKEP